MFVGTVTFVLHLNDDLHILQKKAPKLINPRLMRSVMKMKKIKTITGVTHRSPSASTVYATMGSPETM